MAEIVHYIFPTVPWKGLQWLIVAFSGHKYSFLDHCTTILARGRFRDTASISLLRMLAYGQFRDAA